MLTLFDTLPDHDGATYSAAFDKERLNAQTRRVFDLMSDGLWRTLGEISAACGDPEASVSARLRDLRKEKFGGHLVGRRRRTAATWEYQLKGNS